MSRNASSIETCSTSSAYLRRILMKSAEYALYVFLSFGTRMRFGHFLRADMTGSPVVTPYFFAGIDLAVMMPCRVSTLPPTAEGTVRRSRADGSSRSRLTALQERNAELTSIWKIMRSAMSCVSFIVLVPDDSG